MYDHVFYIPIKRPSEYGEGRIKQKALEMSKRYGVTNVVAWGVTVSDEKWNDHITLGMTNLSWDYAAGSIMKISYRRVHGLGVRKYKGKRQLLLDGKVLGSFVLSENGKLKGYLEEMERLGVYIPFL